MKTITGEDNVIIRLSVQEATILEKVLRTAFIDNMPESSDVLDEMEEALYNALEEIGE